MDVDAEVGAGETAAPVSLESLGLEKFEVVEIHRSELKNAPYNPRRIGDSERRKLKAALERHGLVAPVTWNRASGFIVGGHQRIGQMDALAGTKDYTLRVAAIDVDVGREKELNLLLNNQQAMGDWDIEGLEEMLRDTDLDLTGTDFDDGDLYRMFGDSMIETRSDVSALDRLADKVREARDRYDAIRKNSQKRDQTEFYLVAVFRDEPDCSAFLKAAGLPDNRYQSGEDLRRLCGMLDGGEKVG